MAITSWKAYLQVEEEAGQTVGTLIAARTGGGYAAWMTGEIQKRGFTPSWTPNLPYLLRKSGLTTTTVPTNPLAVRTTGQLWPRS